MHGHPHRRRRRKKKKLQRRRTMEQVCRKGPWTPQEDKLLSQYVNLHGEGRWSSVATGSGLNRSGKSCRLRWVNYLRPGLKRGHLSPQEEAIIIELHGLWGNKWSTIASYLPGRTDNEIKNYWRTHFNKMNPVKRRTSQKQQKRKDQIGRKPADKKLPPTSERSSEEKETVEPCGRDDPAAVFTDSAMADQCFSTTYEDLASWAAAEAAEDLLWGGGIWDAAECEEVTENHVNNHLHGNRLEMEQDVQAGSPCFGGDSNVFCNGEFIF